MIETEKHLLARNRLAATIGEQNTMEVLKEFREKFISSMKAIVPTQNDPLGINLQRALGRVEAIEFLLSEAERATKPQSNKE